MPSATVKAYSPQYIELCFNAWYAGGRPNKVPDIIDLLPKDEKGRIPKSETVKAWREEGGWDWRADELDVKVSMKTDDFLVEQKSMMVKEQAARARLIQQMALNYLIDEGFDSSASAVQAIIKGAGLEKESRGIDSLLQKLSILNDEDLMDEIKRLTATLSEDQRGNIVDADTVSNEEESTTEPE